MPGTPKISFCMIVRNEEDCLERCLKSVSSVVDEIIIIDTGSTDRTKEIALAFTSLYYVCPWQDSFSLARNESIKHATGDWILTLDADEILEETPNCKIGCLVSETEADAFTLIIKNVQPSGSLVAFTPSRITRLFRNRPDFRYEGAIHEQIRPSITANGGRIEDCDLSIIHDGYAKKIVQGSELRVQRNLKILEQELHQSPDDPYLLYQLGVTYKAMGKAEDALECLQKTLHLPYQNLGKETLNDLFMKLGQLELEKENFPLAANYAKSSLKYDPHNSHSQYVLALSQLYQGNIRDAYEGFKKIRRNPNLEPSGIADLDQVIRFCARSIAKSKP
jgi:glycosyltransferase involved in cell wall biosynthesis